MGRSQLCWKRFRWKSRPTLFAHGHCGCGLQSCKYCWDLWAQRSAASLSVDRLVAFLVSLYMLLLDGFGFGVIRSDFLTIVMFVGLCQTSCLILRYSDVLATRNKRTKGKASSDQENSQTQTTKPRSSQPTNGTFIDVHWRSWNFYKCAQSKRPKPETQHANPNPKHRNPNQTPTVPSSQRQTDFPRFPRPSTRQGAWQKLTTPRSSTTLVGTSVETRKKPNFFQKSFLI